MKDSEEIISELLNEKFGTENTRRITELVKGLINQDALIVDKKPLYLENLLSVTKEDISKILGFLYDLSSTNYFAAAFFIEKIPLLYFYDLLQDYITLISLTRHYSSRSVAYALGSSDLKSNDLDLNVKTVKIKLYKKILKILIRKHEDLDIVGLHILRYLAKIIPALDEEDLEEFFEICVSIRSNYGSGCAIAFLDNFEAFINHVPLKKVLPTFEKLIKVSSEYLLFIISYPEVLNQKEKKRKKAEISKSLQIEILKNNDYCMINSRPDLLQDKYFLALLMSWKKYPSYHKNNIIQQFETNNFKQTVLKNPKIIKDVAEIKRVTKNSWFENWAYAGMQVDNSFIYEEIRKILLPSSYFKHNTKRIYNEQKKTFEAIKIEPKTNLLTQLLDYLIKNCTDKDIEVYLKELQKYLQQPSDLFLKKYSVNNLFIKTWDREPWVDYARSDELYACTSIGEATDYFATAYLADITNNNLDIYNNDQRIGRMHFFIIKDSSDIPILLFDCIDGSDRLMRNETRLNYLLDSIKSYSKFVGISMVFFNTDLMFNNTPKHFVRFLKSKFEEEKSIYVKRYLKNASQKYLMSFPLISFSESLKEKNEGVIKGFLVNLNSK